MNSDDFGSSSWDFKRTQKAVRSSDNQTATVEPKTTAGQSARVFQNLKDVPLDTDWTHMEVECKSANQNVQGGVCYVDYRVYNNRDEKGYHNQNPHTDLGSKRMIELDTPINQSNYIYLYLQNKNENDKLVFAPPKIRLVSYTYHKANYKVEEKNGMKKVTAIIPKDGKTINLHSMHLQNHFKTDGNMNYDNYAELPIIANGTHIVGIDLLDQSYLSLWKSNGNYFFMPIKARKQFEISFYVIEAETSNYKEALEVWYSKFPEIYHTQKYGVGAWVPFMSKEYYSIPGLKTDLLAHFWWGSSGMKDHNEFKYVEPTLLHIDIPYIDNAKEMEASLIRCRDQEEVDAKAIKQKKYCRIMIDYGFRNQTGDLYTIYKEERAWNNGIAGRIQMVDDAFYFKFNDTMNALKKENSPFKGIGLDSFTSYAKAYNGAFGDYPYDLVQNEDELYLPAHVALFSSLIETGSKTNMANTAALNPQFVQYIDHVGYECHTFPGKNNFIANTERIWKTLRYVSGSRAISMLENTHREQAFPFAESYFSVCAAYGIIPSYFSYDASTNNFWTNRVDMERIRPYYKRWGPYLMEVLNGSIYYPNSKGLVETNGNVTMWCKGEQCYLMVLVVNDTEIKLKNGKTGFCYFQAEKTKCSSSGSTIKLSTNEPYRTVIVKFGNENFGGALVSMILSPVLLVCGVACSTLIFIKNRNHMKSILEKSLA